MTRKTAEEILKDHFSRSIPEGRSMWESAVNAANQYGDLRAAQEVEAYKERIKSEIGERITNDNHDSCAQAFDSGLHTALTIIDTVK